MIRRSKGERVFELFNILLMILLSIVFLYPYVNQLAISLNDARDTARGGVYLWPRTVTWDNYDAIFKNTQFVNASVVSVMRVLVGTLMALFVTYSAAYALSKRTLPGRMGITTYLLIPMFISGGLIPTFVLFRFIGIMNTFWVYILPGLFSFYNMIIFRTFLHTIPSSLEESVMLDGANSIQIMTHIYIPLSMPVIATVTLWLAVGQWNDWTTTLFFVQSKALHTLQYMMYRLLKESELIVQMVAERARQGLASSESEAAKITPESMKAATLMMSTLPIVCVYPFLQKYFVKGIMIGAIKE